MKYLYLFSQLLSFLLVGVISFSTAHAKDVTIAASTSPNKTPSALQVRSAKTLDNGIHHEAHTHVEHQTLNTLLKTQHADQPSATSRMLKKGNVSRERQLTKLRDGSLGFYLPSFA